MKKNDELTARAWQDRRGPALWLPKMAVCRFDHLGGGGWLV